MQGEEEKLGDEDEWGGGAVGGRPGVKLFPHQINSEEPPNNTGPHSVDLDQLFNFLSQVGLVMVMILVGHSVNSILEQSVSEGFHDAVFETPES